MIQRETVNVIQLGIGVCFICTAGITQGFTVQPVLSARSEEDPRFSPYAGYYSAIVALFVYVIANIFTPLIVMLIGAKWSLVTCSLGYGIYMAGFLFLDPYFLYFSSVLLGASAALLWTASGLVLVQNSTEKTISRNSGIMWMLFMCSLIIGGIFLIVVFSTSTEKISVSLTRIIYSGYTVFCLAGAITFLFLRQPAITEKAEETSVWSEFKKSISLLTTVDMVLLFPLFIFTGWESGFYCGVYSTALASTTAFNFNTNLLIAFNSIAVGLGEIAAGLPLIILGSRANRFGISPIMLIGSISGCIAFILTYINIPGKASFETTDDVSLIKPSIPIALLAGFLMGVCDSCVNTGFYSYVSIRYENEATQVNAVMKLIGAMPNIFCLFAGSFLELQWQILALCISGVLSFVSFAIAERRYKGPAGTILKMEDGRNFPLIANGT